MIHAKSGERIIGADLTLDLKKVAFDLNGTYLNIKDDEDYNIKDITVLSTTRDFILRLKDRGFIIAAYTAAFFNRVDQLHAAVPDDMAVFDEYYTRETLLNKSAPQHAAARIGRAHLVVRQRNDDPVALRWRYVTPGDDLTPENAAVIENGARNREKVPAITGAAHFYDDFNAKIKQLKDPMPRVKILKPASIPTTGREQEAYIESTFGLLLPRTA